MFTRPKSLKSLIAAAVLIVAFVLCLGLQPASAGGVAVQSPPAGGGLVSYLAPYSGHLDVGVWSDLYVGSCHVQTQYGVYASQAFTRIHYVSGNCSFRGERLGYAYGGVFWAYPDDGSGTNNLYCTPGSQTQSFCTQLAGGDIWIQPNFSGGTGLVGGAYAACSQQTAGNLIYTTCAKWDLSPF